MSTEWVDFKVVKQTVSMQMVLDHYGINGLAKYRDELRGKCPIHHGSAKSNKTFCVNLHKNAFQCFAKDCKARGNVLDFVSRMERCDIHEAALKLQTWFKVGETQSPSESSSSDSKATCKVPLGIYKDSKGFFFEVIANAISSESGESLIVYRELFSDYHYLVGAPQNFGQDGSLFVLEKTL